MNAAKQKGQRTKAFLRVLKYSNGGVLEVIKNLYADMLLEVFSYLLCKLLHDFIN